jgi:hypothetical protein
MGADATLAPKMPSWEEMPLVPLLGPAGYGGNPIVFRYGYGDHPTSRQADGAG